MESRVLVVALAVVLASGCISVQGTGLPVADDLSTALLDPARPLVVEFGAVEGYRLDRGALLAFQQTLAALTGRSGIGYTDTFVLPPQGGNYTPSSLQAIHEATTRFGAGAATGHVHLRVLVLDGRMAGDGTSLILGTILDRAGLIVLFPDTYAHAHRLVDGDAVPAVADMDRHVLLHELGHALGLVNRGVSMVRDHEDLEHPGHSSNPVSVMYHRPPMERDGLVHGPGAAFDVDDLADLAAYRAALGHLR